MKKTVLYFLILIFGQILLACTQESVLEPPENQKSTRVSLENALMRADRLFERMGRSSTRSSKVTSVEYYPTYASTRSADSSPLYYVVNYGDDEGFAVLGADTRVDAVYALAEEGHLSMEDTVENVGLGIFFSMLPTNPNSFGQGLDTLPAPGMVVIPKPKDISYKEGPWLSRNVRNWSQGNPYNTDCPTKTDNKGNNANCLVGCAPLAVGMVMTYYDVPNIKFNGNLVSFEQIRNASPYVINSISEAMIPTFLRDLGRNSRLHAVYGLKETHADTEGNYKRTFEAYGFQTPSSFKDFNLTDIQPLMCLTHKPVLIRGKQKESGAGHAWVIDGIMLDCVIDPITNLGHGDGLFLHMVWGGTANGWFKIGGSIDPSYKYNGSGDFWTGFEFDSDKNKSDVQFKSLRYVGDFKLK